MNGYKKSHFNGSHWPTLLISFMSSILVSCFLLAAISSYSKSVLMFQIVDSWKLRDSLIYSTSIFSSSCEEMDVELENILATPGVLDANIVSTLTIQHDRIMVPPICLVQYSDSLLRDVRYQLSEGVYPSIDQKNAILIPYVLHPFFNVGDVIEGYTFSRDHNLGDPLIPVTVTVTGILSPQPLLYPGSGYSKLTELFPKRPDAAIGDIPLYHGVVFRLEDNAGNPVIPQPEGPYIIRSDGSVSAETLQEDLKSVLTTPSRLQTGNEMVDVYIDENRAELSGTISLMITSFILSFSILTASTLLELVYRKKEMAVLYLCGASWGRCLWITLSRQIIPILTAFPAGILLFLDSQSIGLYTVIIPQITYKDIFTTLIIEIIFVSATILPFRFLPKFKSPHELFRKD